jgi:hypothetical protein
VPGVGHRPSWGLGCDPCDDAGMEPGFKVETGPVARRSSRGAMAVGLAMVVGLAVVVAKPWIPSVPVPNASTAPLAVVATPKPSSSATASEASAWPVAPSREGGSAGSSTSSARAVAALLVDHAGDWGIGAVTGSVGSANASSIWAPVTPEPTSDSPSGIALWPGTEVCGGLPTLDSLPTVIGLTTPPQLRPSGSVVAWWTDGVRVASVVGSIRRLAIGAPGVALLERVDGSPWPAGRYEFHVAGPTTLALSVCLAAPA